MRKLLLSLAILFSAAIAKGQLNSISAYPNPATSNDQVNVVLTTTFAYNCISDSFNVVITGSQIQIYMYQCLGMLQIVCQKNDTVNIGQLPVGTYIVYVFISTAQANPSCSMYGPPTPQNQMYTIQVNQTTSAEQPTGPGSAFSIYPNPSGGALHFSFPAEHSFFTLVISDISGKEAGRYPLNGSRELTIPESTFAKGMYFVKLEGNESSSLPQKLLISE
jgi:hypothetical protein